MTEFREKFRLNNLGYLSDLSYLTRRLGVSRKAVVVAVAVALVATSFPIAAFLTAKPAKAAWYNDDWHYRKSILFTHSGAESNVYLSLSGANALDTSASGRYQSDCGDLRFTDANGNLLSYFLVSGCGTATTVVHVLYGTMPAGDQYLYVYYGNSTVANGTTSFDFSTAATGITFGSVGSEETSQGPVAEWKFDEGYGASTKDSSTNGNNGTLTNSPTWQSPDMCVSGKCLYFNGSTNYVDGGNGSSIQIGTGSMSAGVWFRTDVVPSSYGILLDTKGCLSNTAGYGLYTNATNIFAGIGNGSSLKLISVSNTKYVNGQWHYLVFTLQRAGSDTLNLYIDGTLVGTSTNPAGWDLTHTNNLNIGRGNCGGATYFNGSIDDPAIYNYARSQSQIQQDYAAGLTSMNQQQGNLGNGLVGYWKMDDNVSGNSQTLKDSSGGGNNATTFNGPNTTGMDCTVAAKFGGGCSFDGVDDYATTPLISLGNTYTISTWVKTTSSTTSLIFSNYNSSVGFNEAMQLSSKAIISPKDTNNIQQSATSSTSINDGNWHLVTGTVDWNRMVTKIYVDGRFEASTTLTGSPKTGDSTASYIAARATNGVPTINFYTGSLDDLRTYTRALSGSEVQQLYNFGPPPVAAYNFEEPAGGSANDISGNGMTLGIIGTPPPRVVGAHGLAAKIVAGGNYMSTGATTIANPNRFTMSAWVKPNSVMTGGIMGFGTDNIFQIQSDGSLYLRVRRSDGAYPGGTTTATNIYTAADINHYIHVAVTFDGSTATFYKNGAVVGQTSYSMAAYSESVPLQVGYLGTSYFNGGVDDAYFYNYPLTPNQVMSLYAQGSSTVDHPVGWWKMDEGQGTTANNSGVAGSALNGTLTNMSSPPTATSGWSAGGKFGNALNFDGTDDFIGIGNPSALQFSSSFSISAWVKISTISKYNEILAKSDSTSTSRAYELRTQATTGVPYFLVYAGGSCTGYAASGSKAVPIGSWHYISGAYDGQTGKSSVYMDGVLVGSGSVTGTVCGSNGNTSIGRLGDYSTDSGSNTSGTIDDVKIWGSALSSQDILADFNRAGGQKVGSPGTENVTTKSGATGTQPSNSKNSEYCVPGDTSSCAGPVGEWKFEEGAGTSAKDTSGSGNNGTWAGSGTSHWAPGKIGTAGNFNGTDDYVSTVYNSSLAPSTFTVQAWTKLSTNFDSTISMRVAANLYSGGVDGFSFGKALGTNLYFASVGTGTGSNGVNSTSAAVPGVWTFLTMSYDGTTLKLYVNGQLNNSVATNYAPAINTHLFTIGATSGGSIGRFNGEIDQVRLYNYARTPAQVAWDYNKGGPVAWYKMDECSGSTVHSSTNPYNVALNGTITIGATGTQTAVGTCQASGTAWGNGASGKRGASLNFDGTDDYTAFSSSPINLSAGAVSLWFKPSSSQVVHAGGYYIFAHPQSTNASRIYIATNSSGSNVQCILGGGTSIAVKTISANTWHHATCVWNGTSAAFYVDGKNVTTTSTFGGLSVLYPNIYLGALSSSSTETFQGQIDDVQIFDYTLTPTQVATLYNGGSVYWGQ